MANRKAWRRDSDAPTFERKREARAARKRDTFERSHVSDKRNPYRKGR